MFENIVTFPFLQIAELLRYLSLSSSIGNIFAIVIYALFCLIPIFFLMFQWSKHRVNYIDGLLPIISILMFIVIYQLINPLLLQFEAATMTIPCITVYSVICTYILLKLIRLFQGKAIDKLCKYLIMLLWTVNIVLLLSVLFSATVTFAQSIKDVQATNTGNTDSLGLTYTFMFLGMIVDLIPSVTNIIVVFFCIRLVKHFIADRYSEKTVYSADKLSRVCKWSIVVTVLSSMIFNIFQYVFASHLHKINININFPILSIVFTLAVFVLSQMISEDKALKDDNDSII